MEGMRLRLKAGVFLEHAAALEGIPARMVLVWIKLGRQGKKPFNEFVDMIDRQNAELASGLIEPIYAAVKEGNLEAAKWLYKTRMARREEHFERRVMAAEDVIETKLEEAESVDERELEAAEERALSIIEDQVH